MKNKRALSLLIAAHIVSAIATGISMLAIPWYFTSILKEPSLFGELYIYITIGTVFWSVYAGSLVDRYPRKNLFLAMTGIGSLILGTVSLTGFATGEIPTLVVASVFAFTIFHFQMYYPSLYAFSQELAEQKRFGRINSILEVQGQATNMISGALAAMLLNGLDADAMAGLGLAGWGPIAPWSLHEIFLIDSCTFALAFLLILGIRYERIHKGKIDTDPVWQRIRTGWRFLMDRKPLFIFGNFAYSIFAVILVDIFMLMPLYIDTHLEEGPDRYALGRLVFSMGALMSGVFIRRVFRKLNYLTGIMALMLMCGLWFWVLAFSDSSAIFYLISFGIGISNAGTRVLRVTYLFHLIPNTMIGRATSVFQMINILVRLAFISLFTIPFFSTGDNVVYAYMITGSFILLSVIPLVLISGKLPGKNPEMESSEAA